MALKVMTHPPQAFSADFELDGDSRAGSLVLSTALGSTLARMRWDGSSATLQTQGAPEQFDSLASLLRHATGTDLPVAGLFAWLRGQIATVPEWEADLSQLDNGRLTARRSSALEPAELKIVLDR
jgi:outer membrane lipoprotein LolB